jgi:hypothetical protein
MVPVDLPGGVPQRCSSAHGTRPTRSRSVRVLADLHETETCSAALARGRWRVASAREEGVARPISKRSSMGCGPAGVGAQPGSDYLGGCRALVVSGRSGTRLVEQFGQ